MPADSKLHLAGALSRASPGKCDVLELGQAGEAAVPSGVQRRSPESLTFEIAGFPLRLEAQRLALRRACDIPGRTDGQFSRGRQRLSDLHWALHIDRIFPAALDWENEDEGRRHGSP